jgi:glycosyltransferase involved in cell wall biosynthesis
VSHTILVVPCFDEEKRLDLGVFRRFLAGTDDVDFIFVNDGSRDDTLRVLQRFRDEAPSRIAVLDLQPNRGKAEAVRHGLAVAIERKPDYAGFWDADLATPLEEIRPMVDILDARREIAMVFGARVRLLGRDISRHASRHYFGRLGATLISQTLSLAVYDTQCGAKIFRATSDAAHVFSSPFLSRWIFDVEVIARYVRLWGRDAAAKAIYEYPVRAWKDVGGSKIKGRDFLRALRDLRKIRRAYKMRIK